jgi:Icc-related predicted phosphoesterase
MNLLALSDRVVEGLYGSPEQARSRLANTDLIIGCGDLPYYYLEFFATIMNTPVAYVHGNHDRPTYTAEGKIITAPGGCISLEGRCLEINGLLMAGLGGSIRYSPDSDHQYTEMEMWRRIFALMPHLLFNRLRSGRMLDILVTHSPPRGIHDAEDLPHHGFKSFLTLLRMAKPRLLLHGHTHVYRRNSITRTRYVDTTVINVYPNKLIDWGDYAPR